MMDSSKGQDGIGGSRLLYFMRTAVESGEIGSPLRRVYDFNEIRKLYGGVMSQHRSERETELGRKRSRRKKNLKLRAKELKALPKKK
jgi:hypothetical protein